MHTPPCPRTRVRADPGLRGGGGRIRTYEGVSRQIYSLLPLAAWVPLRENEPRILISQVWGVNASWRGICWVGVGSGAFFQSGRAKGRQRGLLGSRRRSHFGGTEVRIELLDLPGNQALELVGGIM